jgi:hypothetical protein
VSLNKNIFKNSIKNLFQITFLSLLTAILIHQLYDISIDYFSYKTVIIIDTKAYESDNNYPFVTLSTRNRQNLFLFEIIKNPWDYWPNFTVSNRKLIDKPAQDNIWRYISVEFEGIITTMVTVNSSQYLDGHYYVYVVDDNLLGQKDRDVYFSTRTINFNHNILNAKQTGQFAIKLNGKGHNGKSELDNNGKGRFC